VEQTRILVVSSFALLREGLCALLGGHRHLRVVGEIPSWDVLGDQVSRTRPHVVLVDVPRVDSEFEDLVRDLKEGPWVPAIVALSRQEDEASLLRILKSGVEACLCEGTGSGDLVAAIEAVMRGSSFLCPAASRALLQDYRRQATRRHVENRVESVV
jgi:DNA-binding NarL/FixJ family response regulator